MSNPASYLKFNPALAAAPNYIQPAGIEVNPSPEMIQLAANESMLPPSAKVMAALQTAATELHRYPVEMGDGALRTALAETLGRGLTPAHFITGNGGCDVLAMIATAFLEAGDECIICRPTFPVYELLARRSGAVVTYVDLDPVGFSYDMEAILAAINERTRLLFLCTPNNPTGTLLTAAQMERLVSAVPPHVLIVSDEVYHPFVTAADFPDTPAYVRAGHNVLVLHSFSKVFGLAGLRLGYAIAPPEIAAYVSRARQPYHLGRLTVTGALAAVEDEAHLQKTVELTLSGRQWLYESLQQLGLPVWPSQANFLLCQPHGAPAEVSRRLAQRGVAVRPLGGFYMPKHLRVTVGLPEENERFIAALTAVLAEVDSGA